MRRLTFASLLAILVCAIAPSASTQPKPKDPVMYSEMQNQFGRVTQALTQILARLEAIEGEVNRLKQVEADVRAAQSAVRTTDAKLADFSTGATRDLIDLKRDMTQLRSDVVSLGSEMRRGFNAQAPAQPAPAQQAQLPEGYIQAVAENEVTINLGSGAGVRVGMRFAVFKAGDASKTQVGTIAIKEVLDANNSKADIVFMAPGVKFDFSDGVRPLV